MESLEERYAAAGHAARRAQPQRGVPAHRRRAARPAAWPGCSMVAANYGVPRRNLGTVSLFGPDAAWTTAWRWRRSAGRPRSSPITWRACTSDDEGEVRPIDDRFEILEVWRRPLRGDAAAAVRVLAKVEAGAYGPEEYAVGISTAPRRPPVAAAGRGRPVHRPVVRRGPLGGRRAGERRRPGGGRREPAVRPARAGRPGLARGGAGVGGDRARRPALGARWCRGSRRASHRRRARYAIATYTLDCGHQAVELLRQDPDARALLGGGRRGGPPGRARRAQPHAPALPRGQPRGGPADLSRRRRPTSPSTPTTTTRTTTRGAMVRLDRLGALAPDGAAAAVPAARCGCGAGASRTCPAAGRC